MSILRLTCVLWLASSWAAGSAAWASPAAEPSSSTDGQAAGRQRGVLIP